MGVRIIILRQIPFAAHIHRHALNQASYSFHASYSKQASCWQVSSLNRSHNSASQSQPRIQQDRKSQARWGEILLPSLSFGFIYLIPHLRSTSKYCPCCCSKAGYVFFLETELAIEREDAAEFSRC